MTPEVLVVGPGALGGLLAALLVEGGVRAALLAKDAAGADALRAGLTLEGPGDRPARTVPVPVVTEVPDGLPLALLCVKVKDTERALAALRGRAATVVVLQNGLGRAEAAAAALGAGIRVVGAVTSEGATRLGPARVRHAGRGITRLAPLEPEGRAGAAAAVELLRRAGLEAALLDHGELRRAVWEKLQVNAAINALTGLLDRPNGALLAAPSARELARTAAREVAAVAARLGVPGDWSDGTSDGRWEAVARATAANLSSTVQDLRSARTTEVGAINGAVARAASEAGLAAPVNDLLARLIAAREESFGPAPPVE